MPDLYVKDYANLYEVVGKINIELEYDVKNSEGNGYLFQPSYTAGWNMNYMIEKQIESEIIKTKPTKTLTIKQLTKKDKWWKVF